MERALYGPDGFYTRPGGPGPAGHFRTSVHASPLYARAIARLLCGVDAALGRPDELALVDVGAGRGELLTGVLAALPEVEAEIEAEVTAEAAAGPDAADGTGTGTGAGKAGASTADATAGMGGGPASVLARVRPYAVERAARPEGLDPRIVWKAALPSPGSLTGLLFANEWLDNVPVEVVEVDVDGVARRVLVREDGTERLGDPVAGADARWLARWWPGLVPGEGSPEPSAEDSGRTAEGGAVGEEAAGVVPVPLPGARAEVGRSRDAAWARAVRSLRAGLAVTADYAHERAERPPFGTLTGFREGREVRPVPDGSCDITAHVALDSCGGPTAELLPQRRALRALGVDGRRPPLALASTDPVGYLRALASAGAAAELTDPAGLGGFGWLVEPVGPACVGLLRP